MGGRLVSLFYKPENRELLHVNPVFQPANLAIRNAWFSGGIEWNIGQFGHTFTTCAPVFAAAIRGAQGEPGLRLYEFERCKRLFWQIDFTLPPGLPFLVAYTRVINPNPEPTSMYWWTNTAVDERPGVRVLAPARQALYGAFESRRHRLWPDRSARLAFAERGGRHLLAQFDLRQRVFLPMRRREHAVGSRAGRTTGAGLSKHPRRA